MRIYEDNFAYEIEQVLDPAKQGHVSAKVGLPAQRRQRIAVERDEVGVA